MIGVGLVGAGPVVQAIHLPTLALLADRFTVRHVLDVNPAVGDEVADRIGAKSSTELAPLLQDPEVEVVAICSPPRFHADQVIASMRAGKRLVFCEKPLAETAEDARRIAEASEETGVPLVVGAMHTYDPAWLAVAADLGPLRAEARAIRSSIVLPPNDRFEDWATEVIERVSVALPAEMDADTSSGFMAAAVLGLAIHDLPLVRRFLPRHAEVQVTAADLLQPFGYALTITAGDRTAEIVGLIQAHWRPRWEFEVISATERLEIEFTPSFVQAGSGVSTLEHGRTATRHGPFDHNGYEGEWRAIHDILSGDMDALPALTDLIDDLTFAASIADQAAALIRSDLQP